MNEFEGTVDTLGNLILLGQLCVRQTTISCLPVSGRGVGKYTLFFAHTIIRDINHNNFDGSLTELGKLKQLISLFVSVLF